MLSHLNKLQIDSSAVYESSNFNIVTTNPDGNCLFTSIFDFIEQNRSLLVNPPDPPQSVHQVRTEAVKYILSKSSGGFQENWERFFDNIEFNLRTRIKDIEQYGNNERRNEEIKRSYSEYMSRPGNFGRNRV